MEKPRLWRKHLGCVILSLSTMFTATASAQELLKAIEPGTGYSRMKQWAIEHRLYFENFTKDSLVIGGPFQDPGDPVLYQVNLLVKFCAGDDYAGRAYSMTLQQTSRLDTQNPRLDTQNVLKVFEKYQSYLESLAGKPSQEGNFPGEYTLRRAKMPDQKGVAVGFTSNQGKWELGFFVEPTLTIQVVRTKDELCK